MSVVLVQKLIVAGIVDITSIVHFMFSKTNTTRLTSSVMFEILVNTLNIITARTKKLKEDLESAQKEKEKVMDLVDGPDKAMGIEKARSAKESLDKALKVKKEVFLGVFQRFVMTLTNHLSDCEKEGKDPANMWLACTLARLRMIGRTYYDDIKPFLSTLDMLIFTSSGNADGRINDVFESFKEL